MDNRDDLAAILDPDVFDPDRKFSKHPAAVVQVAARRHMAYEGADRVLAAGWVPSGQRPCPIHKPAPCPDNCPNSPEYLTRRQWETVNDALAAEQARNATLTDTIRRVEALVDEFALVKGHELSERELRVVAKYAVPEVMQRHTVTYVLAKLADELRRALGDPDPDRMRRTQGRNLDGPGEEDG